MKQGFTKCPSTMTSDHDKDSVCREMKKKRQHQFSFVDITLSGLENKDVLQKTLEATY